MRTSFLCILISILFFFSHNLKLYANYTEIAGDLPKIVTEDKSPYLVISDIFVSPGKIVHIEAGTVFLFKNFTGLHIQGQLIVDGTETKPVLFTSENDHFVKTTSKMNPTPFDWNGIYIHKDGVGTDLQNIHVKYSVKGIVSETRFIRISGCIFFENGRSDLVVEGEQKSIMQSTPFFYSLSVKDATVDGVPIKILYDPLAIKRNTLRYVGLGICAAGAVAGTFSTMEFLDSKKQYEKIQSVSDTTNLIRKDGHQAWSKARSEVKRDLACVITSFLFSAAGALSLTLSFTF